MKPRLYAAPMEGVTGVIYRQVHHRLYPGVDKYFIPFISPTEHLTFSSREQREMDPAENAGVPVVPQILTKNAESFVRMTELLRDNGYTEVNLNLGCPSGTVTAKGKGSGMLRDPDTMRAFLDEVYARSPLPVSIKTRIGYASPDEWPRLYEIYKQYPVSEMIVHMRTREMQYRGEPFIGLSADLIKDHVWPFVYNGDLFTAEDCRNYLEAYPADGLMLGRGLIANPALVRELQGGRPLSKEDIVSFRKELIGEYLVRWPDHAVLGRMHEMDTYFAALFLETEKPRRQMRKARNMAEYEEAAKRLFEECEMKENPGFTAKVFDK